MALDPWGDLVAHLRFQAGHCARLGSPFYAFLLERAAEDLEDGGPAGRTACSPGRATTATR